MKKLVLLFLISLSNFLSVNAQRTDLIYSTEKFPEKEISKYKLEILNNGNTANICIHESIGFFCDLYDSNKKIIAHTVVPIAFELQNVIMKSVFEVNNEVVVFILSYDKNAPALSRYIFDGVTGKLKKEEIVMSRPPAKALKVMSAADYANVIPSDFFIQKDPNSDYYAIGYFDYWAEDVNKKIEVIHYSPTHEIVSKAFLVNPDNTYSKLSYAALYVNGGKSVILYSYLYNIKDDKIKESGSCFYLSELKSGAVNFRSTRAVETAYYFRGEALFIFNKVTNKIQLISVVWVNNVKGKNGGYNIISQTLDVETLALSELINLYSEKLDAVYMAAYSGQHYRGFPQQYSINSKGNTIILSQLGTYNTSVFNTQFEEIGISSWTPGGQDTYGARIHYINAQATKMKSFVYARGLNGQYACGNYADEYVEMYVGLISGKSNSYVFLNNTAERFEMDKVPTIWTPINKNNPGFTSFIYTLNDEGVVSKEYIFGKPASETETKYCRFNTADYDPVTGLYAVIVVERIKGKKTISVLWMNLK